MDSLQLFTQRIPELENLPLKPKIFFYPSAGIDFRGCVAFTNHRIKHELQNDGRDFTKPELFIYSCIGKEVLELKEKLSQGDVELRNDQSTRIIAKNYQSLQIRDDIYFEINPDYIDTDILNLNDYQTDSAFYFDLEVSGHNYIEFQKVLYFEAENIDFFNQIILKNIFETEYLCTTREGLSWGGCKKSIIDYIYSENQEQFFIGHGFKPTFQILSNNYTKRLFEDASEGTMSFEPKYGNYISERDDFTDDSEIYKINYLT